MKKKSSRKAIQLHFGKHVRTLRTRKGWSQEKLADVADLHRTYIGGIERGERNVSLVNIEKLAASLEVSIRHLFEEQ